MGTPATPLTPPSASGAVAIIQEIAMLEPIAFNLVASLVRGLKGKSDADILASDATDLSSIVAIAHSEQSK